MKKLASFLVAAGGLVLLVAGILVAITVYTFVVGLFGGDAVSVGRYGSRSTVSTNWGSVLFGLALSGAIALLGAAMRFGGKAMQRRLP